jgi:hypothetical protein
MRPSVKVAVLASFAAMAASSTWAATQLVPNFELRDLCPDESYARDYMNEIERLFGTLVDSLPVYFITKGEADGVQYHTFEAQLAMSDLTEALLAAPSIHGPVFSWHQAFTSWIDTTIPVNSTLRRDSFTGPYLTDKLLFHQALHGFFESTEGAKYAADVVFQPVPVHNPGKVREESALEGAGSTDNVTHVTHVTHEIVAARILTFHEPLATAVDQVQAMEEIEAVIAANALSPNLIAFCYPYIFIDQVGVLRAKYYGL